MAPRNRVALVFGTRPEATKMAPVYQALLQRNELETTTICTGQHREQIEHATRLFDMPIDVNLDVMMDRQTLPELAARVVPGMAAALEAMSAEYVLVHGDTLSTFAAAWASFLIRVPVGHVEAGLRSHDLSEPFPEEANRRLTDVLTDLSFAPTTLSRDNLLREGTRAGRIVVTGQTAVEAVRQASARGKIKVALPDGEIVLVTLHRRENWPVLQEMARALARVAREFPRATFVFPMHLNPLVREKVKPHLGAVPNVMLTEPME